MQGDDIKFLVAERIKECLATPNWPLHTMRTEIKTVSYGLLQLKVYQGGLPDYYTIRISRNFT